MGKDIVGHAAPDRHDATTEEQQKLSLFFLCRTDRDRQICTRIDVHVLMPLFEGGQRFIFNPKISNKNRT